MCTMDTGEIIILSDDDDDCESEISCNEPSVLIVEMEDVKKKNSDCTLAPTALDEDLVVTFSRCAEVLPHARYDCPIHPFTATDCEIGDPVASNMLMCDQCFCYICDKLASSCAMWSRRGGCHCNSHKRSDFWNSLRKRILLGGLLTFNLTLSEVDDHLRRAETMLHSFREGLAALFTSYLNGKTVEGLGPANQNCIIYDYTPVYEFVSAFLNKADKQEGRAAVIMRLGAAEYFIRHFQVLGTFIIQSPMANAAGAKLVLLKRVIASVQRQMVTGDFSPEFTQKMQIFYKKFNFPTELKSMKNSLCVRPWDDVLLVSVLKGQNVSGVRKDKGKKDVLIEQLSIVLLRTEQLQQQHRYRELCRYLKVVKTDDSKLGLQQLQDLIPFFRCMSGDFECALNSLLPSVNAPASRFTPQLFLFYLCVFKTATAPKLLVSEPEQLCSSGAWEPIKDAVALTRVELVRFALRVQKCCSAVFTDSQCWAILLSVANTPAALPKPSPEFLLQVKDAIILMLESNVLIPRFEMYPDQSLLLLVTQALVMRIISAPLSPAVPVLETYKLNMWALEWLRDSLSSHPERFSSFMEEITKDLVSQKGAVHWI
ncbi:uncharacterized protein zgc:112980 isoform X2 [Centropristis striata]|uniref:uncharacterized protein zgc:112980 isoform X2 n=1 Tax=Centropristis striata TaxID=184440 RepID=UPI0027E19C3C|nr:uncharacterized protein zgc:112980 isoform X2 [Centropristis striata]XP_059190188.1 uncharacterized protein zgc:112980 isoform X2 [Centropristis striata]